MAYVPDPTNVNQPVESVFAKTAAAEFRALKAYIQTLVLGTGQLAAFRNVARNGDFTIAQRGSAVVSAANGFIVDGWQLFNSGVNRLNGQIDTTTHIVRFPATLRLFTVANAAPAAGEIYGTFSRIEGLNVASYLWGTAGAKPVTVSFQVYSTVAGTFAFSVRNRAGTRSYVAPLVVNLPNTWETKTFTIPGDTAGAWDKDNQTGLDIAVGLSVGSTFTTATPSAWVAGNFVGLSTQTMLTVGGGTVWLSEVQVEQSTFATPFEYIPFTEKLERAQRYYTGGTAGIAGSGTVGIGNNYRQSFATKMRATPTLTYSIVSNVNCSVIDVRAPLIDSLSMHVEVTANGGYIGVVNFVASSEMP